MPDHSETNLQNSRILYWKKNCDVVGICETWLTPDDDAVIAAIKPPGYSFIHLPRACKRGGGVGLLYRSELNVIVNPPSDFQCFEMLSATLTSKNTNVDVVIIYRPPGNSLKYTSFLDEFSSMLDERLLKPMSLIITGDFNIHFDNLLASNTKQFNELLAGYDLVQHVSIPTHGKGHILDGFISRQSDDKVFSDLRITPGISDHSAILCNIHLHKPPSVAHPRVMRNIKAIDRTSFATDMMNSELSSTSSPTDDVTARVDLYNMVLSDY